MAWFADLTLDLRSCSFRAKASDSADGDGRCALQQADLGATYPGQMQDSIDKILQVSVVTGVCARCFTHAQSRPAQSASLILQFTQLDSDAFFRRSLQHGGDMPFAAPHWPLIGCCQMVASYGFVVGAALDNRAHTSIATSVGAGLRGGDADQCSQSVVLSSDELYVASACPTGGEGVDTLRQSEQAAGSIALAEATLGALSDVWKVAALYRSEVHQCRLAIDRCESAQETPLWLQ